MLLGILIYWFVVPTLLGLAGLAIARAEGR